MADAYLSSSLDNFGPEAYFFGMLASPKNRGAYVDDQNWHWSNRPVWPVLESGLTGLDHVAGLAIPTGLTGGSDRSDRSTWNPSTTRTLCRFRSVIGFLAG